MHTFIIRRVLLMIPTLFGITFVIWLVMALAPGRPGTKQVAAGDEDMQKDPTKARMENEAQRIFRRQFGLDRPRFWNNWYDLDAAFLRKEIAISFGDIEEIGAEKKREARERLEDYGYYAVPALIRLLQETEGLEQTHVLHWLAYCSVRLPLPTHGSKIDDATLAKHSAWKVENTVLAKWRWPPGAPADERAAHVAKWKEWYEDNRDRWTYSGAEKFRITLTDTQFGTYWGRLLTGDLGTSHLHKRPVVDLVLERLKYSLTLNLVAFLIAYLLAVPTGIWAAVKAGSFGDRVVAIILFMLYSLPNFFVGTLFVQWFAAGQPWSFMPQGGFESEGAADLNTWEHLKDVFKHITLPLICLSYGGLAALSRYSRTGMLDVIRSDYVRTARAKGLSEWTVILKHVVRNGILPIVTILGTALPVLIGGSVAIEVIFNIDGMGLLMYNSILGKDFNVVMGVQIIVAILTMIGILLSDIAYAVLDPRISLR